MNLFDKIDDILEQKDTIISKAKPEFSFDEDIFSRMANFIINLDPDSLSDNQLEEVMDIIEMFEVEMGDIQEVKTPKLAKRTLASKNQASKKWYRANKTEIKRRKKKLRRSSEGRKRLKAKERLAKQGRTATGRRKVRYHVRKRSDRKDREKTLS